MKKIVLGLIFVFVTGSSFLNALSSKDELLPITNNAIEVVENFGCSRDCVDHTLGFVTWFADGVDLNSNSGFMDLYINEYKTCLRVRCGITE